MSTRYKKSPYTAKVMLKASTSLRSATLKQVHQAILKEFCTICSRKHGDSTLRLSTVFSWGPVITELKAHAPTLYSIIQAALAKHGKVKDFAVGVNASSILKMKNKDMGLFQGVVSLVMYAGHCSKQVIQLIATG